MEIILKEDVAHLGHKDDIVTVKSGYAVNFLFPKKKAISASSSAKKILAENKKQQAHKEVKLKENAVEVAAKLENKKLSIGAKTSSTGKIFGSVNTIQLAEAINKKGFDISRKQITIKNEPIKEVGTYTAIVSLHREVKVEMEFTVVSE